MKLPAFFLGHGSPMNAIDDTPYSRTWQAIGQQLRAQYGSEIRAILAVSAHWLTDGVAVTAMPQPRTIHDFGGFPQALFDVQYPAPGSPELAAKIQAMLPQYAVHADQDWGLDHGSWGVLKHLFPAADVPVVQLSLNVRFNARQHFELAQALAPLREQGVLLVASGNIVHNLRAFDWRHAEQTDTAYDWAEQARTLVNRWLLEGDTTDLTNDTAYPPCLHQAAPTPEHFWPLLYLAGVQAKGEPLILSSDEIVGKSLSMTNVIVGLAT